MKSDSLYIKIHCGTVFHCCLLVVERTLIYNMNVTKRLYNSPTTGKTLTFCIQTSSNTNIIIIIVTAMNIIDNYRKHVCYEKKQMGGINVWLWNTMSVSDSETDDDGKNFVPGNKITARTFLLHYFFSTTFNLELFDYSKIHPFDIELQSKYEPRLVLYSQMCWKNLNAITTCANAGKLLDKNES